MTTSFAPLAIRRSLSKSYDARWSAPYEHGPDGWMFRLGDSSVIVSCCDQSDGNEWVHASIAHPTQMPTYEDLKRLHAAVFGDGYAYQVFVPPSRHVNIHSFALHLWGRLDGKPAIPEFSSGGSI